MSTKFRRELPLHIMLIPAVLILAIFAYIPMAGMIMAFENYSPVLGFLRSKWVGFENFLFLFRDTEFLQVLWNTIFIAAMKIAAGIVVPVVYALLLNEVFFSPIKRTVQTIIYLPHFISWVLLGGIIIDILSPTSGIVNQALGLLGIKPIFFLADNNWFPFVIVITDAWKEFGWGTIIYLAAITGIDPTLYEACIVDGAGKWKQAIHITLPGILPIVVLMTILSLGNILNAGFDQIFNLYSPVVYQSGDIIDTLVYRTGIEQIQFGLATATGFFKSVVSFTLIAASYRLAYRYSGYRIF